MTRPITCIVRDRTCFALLNKYPYVGGHLMIVPYKEVADLNGLTDEELADLWKLTRRCVNALTPLMKPDGFNIGINLGKVAGAGVAEHLHIHVVPRWNGDTNFMPVMANTTRPAAGVERTGGETARGTGEIIFNGHRNPSF